MSERGFYLAAYDVSHRRRLVGALEVVRSYATGGQRSAYECYLTAAELREMVERMADCIDPGDDRFALVRLDPRSRVYTLGIAVRPSDPSYYYVG